MGEKQPRADREIEAERGAESAGADSPDVIDLRPHEDEVSDRSTPRAGADATSRSDSRALTASEGWEWLDLGLRISDAQLDVRRTTGRAMNFDRTDVRPRTAGDGATQPTNDRAEPEVEPQAELPVETREGPAAPASGRLTWRDWSNWVRLGRTISDEERAGPSNGDAAVAAAAVVAEAEVAEAEVEPEVAEAEVEPEVAEAEVEPEVAEAEVEPEVAEAEAPPEIAEPEVVTAHPDDMAAAVARTDPHPVARLTGQRLAVVTAVVIAVVLLVVAIAAVLAVRDDEPTPSASARPSASSAAPTPAGRSLAVRWLEQNTAAGTRLLVPPELVDDFAAGLPGRQVFPNDQVAARTGDLLVVTPNSGAVLTGTLTQQVLAAAPVVATLPGSDLEVHQVTGSDPSEDAARASAGTELLHNLGLTFVGGSAALRGGRVDERVLVILAGLASQHSLTVALVPDPADAPNALVRTLQIQGVDGHAITATNARDLKDFVTTQRGALAGPVVDEVDDGAKRQLSVRYLLPASVELLNSGSFPTVSQESP